MGYDIDLILLASDGTGDSAHEIGGGCTDSRGFTLVTTATTGATTATAAALRRVSHGFAHQSEGAFLGNEAEGAKVLDGFLASGVLLTRNDASLVLHEVGLLQAARCMFGGSVPHHCFCTDCWNMCHLYIIHTEIIS